jgi:hypothetical protein
MPYISGVGVFTTGTLTNLLFEEISSPVAPFYAHLELIREAMQ